jgi:hypothetical protein
MGTVVARQALPGASIAEVQTLWLDLDRWPSFVDGYGALARREGDWPQAASRVVWDSLRNGRGRVVEQVTDFEPAVTHLVRIEDPQLRGTQRARFSAYDGGCEISLELDYALKQPGLGGRLTDVLFVRRAVGDGLRRTLRRFAVELAVDRELRSEPQRPQPHSRNEKES